MAKILIVDDDEAILTTLSLHLRREDHDVTTAGNALAALARLDEFTPDLIISDINMPHMDGIEFCTRVRARAETALTPFLFLTGRGESSSKFEALKLGADDYITKPFDMHDVLARVNGRLVHRQRVLALQAEHESIRHDWRSNDQPEQLRAMRERQSELEEEVEKAGFDRYALQPADPGELRAKIERLEARFPALSEVRETTLVGEHPRMLQLFESIVIAASTDDPTLIVGETGAGKTGVAEAIAALSSRAEHPLRTMNCAELAAGDATIALGRLFGYGKHSGLSNIPTEGRPGVLEEVDGGTLFLDEVAVLPAQAQSALLLPLEGRAFHPAVGTGSARTVDVKFIFATNVDLARRAEAGEFPRDLYERIADEVVVVPALRERASDIPLLARRFLDDVAGPKARFDDGAERAMLAYDWPGNVRELRRIVRGGWRRASLEGRMVVTVTDLPLASQPNSTASPREESPLRPVDSSVQFSEREFADLEALRDHEFNIGEASDALGLSRSSRTLSHRLRGMCFKALCLREWDVSAAASWLADDDPDLTPIVARKVRDQADRMNGRLDADEDVHTRHLLADHREYAIATLEHLRALRED